MRCVRWGASDTAGWEDANGRSVVAPPPVRSRFTARFKGAFYQHHHFPDVVIALAAAWYVRCRLSYADVVSGWPSEDNTWLRPS